MRVVKGELICYSLCVKISLYELGSLILDLLTPSRFLLS